MRFIVLIAALAAGPVEAQPSLEAQRLASVVQPMVAAYKIAAVGNACGLRSKDWLKNVRISLNFAAMSAAYTIWGENADSLPNAAGAVQRFENALNDAETAARSAPPSACGMPELAQDLDLIDQTLAR